LPCGSHYPDVYDPQVLATPPRLLGKPGPEYPFPTDPVLTHDENPFGLLIGLDGDPKAAPVDPVVLGIGLAPAAISKDGGIADPGGGAKYRDLEEVGSAGVVFELKGDAEIVNGRAVGDRVVVSLRWLF
jgi:hypothetical protein